MRVSFIVLYTAIVLLSVSLAFLYKTQPKQAFIYTHTVFEKFEGTMHMQQKLQKERLQNQAYLDSLNSLIENGRKELVTFYGNQKDYLSVKDREVNEQYTKDLWQYINEAVKEYGETYGFEVIFGASGDGALMYANKSLDKTNDVILFINAKYANGISVKP